MVVSASAWERDLQAKRLITHSELQTAKDCLQKWQWRYGFGYRRKLISPSTLFGVALHEGLEAYYKGRYWGQDYKSVKLNALSNANLVFNHYIKAHLGDIGEKEADYVDQWGLCTSVMENYIEHYWDNDFTPMPDPLPLDSEGAISEHALPLVEAEFRVPVFTPKGIRSSKWIMGGKIDLIVMIDGEYWVVDHKTRATISDTAFDRLAMDQQMISYCHNAQLYWGVPIAGAIYNIVRRKTPGEVKINKDGTVSAQKCDTDLNIYIATLERQDEYLCSLTPEERKKNKQACGIDFDKYAPEISRLRGIKFFDRHYQRYSQEDYQEIQMEIYQVTKLLHEAVWFPKNDAACDRFSGCAYRGLCMKLDEGGEL